ncbi:hypothetical protein BDF19DRAFT_435192 [Syncephalis fuscata]|nr:hypothetical protein BDF19DRAFT_435192 [Syncephalis fuscata]
MSFNQTGNHNDSWKDNAAYLWGIPLHPSGEMTMYEFVTEIPGDMNLARLRLSGSHLQIIGSTITSIIFLRNLIASVRMTIRRPYIIAGWSCLIPSLFGVGLAICLLLYIFNKIGCRPSIWYFILAASASGASNSIIIVQKAYIILLNKLWVLIVGILFMVFQLAFIPIFIATSYVTIEEKGACAVHYSQFVPLYWFSLIIPVNVLFSVIFSYVAYKQYKLFGSEALKRLAREGIQTMGLVVIINVICVTCILFKVGGYYSDMFFMAEWLSTSTILIYHCENVKKRTVTPHCANENEKSSLLAINIM